MPSLATAYTRILMSTKELKKGIDKSVRMTKDGAGKMSKSFKLVSKSVFSLQNAILGGAGAAGLVYALKGAIDAASKLEEATGKFSVVFKGLEGDAERWSTGLIDSYGLSERAAKEYLSSMQDLLKPMGMVAGEAGKMSDAAVKLAVDLGSFNNLKTEDVLRDIRSAMVGQYEPMLKYGAVLKASTVAQKALEMGLASTVKELTAADKAMASFQLITEASGDAMGDFARTSDGYANSMKILEGRIEDLKATIGAIVIGPVTDMVQKLSEWVKANDDLLKQDVPRYIELVGNAAKLAYGFVRDLADGFYRFLKIAENLYILTEASRGSVDAIKELWKRMGEGKDISSLLSQELNGMLGIFSGSGVSGGSGLIDNWLYLSRVVDGYATVVPKATGGTNNLGNDVDKAGDAAKKAKKEFKDLWQEVDSYMDIAQKQIDLEEKMLELAKDMVDSWQLKAEAVSDTQWAMDSAIEQEREYARVQRELFLASGDFFSGMKLGWQEVLAAQVKWAEQGMILVKKFVTMTEYTLGESMFSAIKGDWEGMRDAWQQLLDDLLRMATNIVAKIIIEFAKVKLFGGASSMFGGGGLLSGGSGPASSGPASSGLSSILSGASVPAGYAAMQMGATSAAVNSGAVVSAEAGHIAMSGAGASGSGGAAGLGAYAGPAFAAFVVAGVVTGIAGMMKIDKDKQITNLLAKEREKYNLGSPEFRQLTEEIRKTQEFAVSGDMAALDIKMAGQYDYAKEGLYGKSFDVLMGHLKGTLAGEGGGDNEVAVDIVTNLVDNASVPLQEKMEALGMVGTTGGWTSDATISMIAEMIDTGIPWNQINDTLAQYGVEDDDIIKEIIGHYTDEGMTLEDLQYMLKESGVPEELLRTINATVDPVVADRGSFNNFQMGYSGPDHLDVFIHEAYATGGTPSPGTLAWVGEQGPELAYFPNGGRVWSHGESMNMANSSGGGNAGPIIVNVEVGGEEFQAYVADTSENNRVRAERAIEGGMPRTRKL